MNILLVLVLFGGMELYFLQDSSDLLARVIPHVQTEQVRLHYSFSGMQWDSTIVSERGRFFDAVITPPTIMNIIGLYAVYDNGEVDDNAGNLYLYEVRYSPRMIMPISITDLGIMFNQAKQKIITNTHVDEAITLLDYIEDTLIFLPFIKNSPSELQKNLLLVEVKNLRKQIGQ